MWRILWIRLCMEQSVRDKEKVLNFTKVIGGLKEDWQQNVSFKRKKENLRLLGISKRAKKEDIRFTRS